MNVIQKAKGFIINPVETFKKTKKETIKKPLTYYIILLPFYIALYAISNLIAKNTFWGQMTYQSYYSIPFIGSTIHQPFGEIIILIIYPFIFALLTIFIGSAIIHLGVLLFGGKNGYKQTLKAITYAGTPTLLLGWIPIIGSFFSIWTLVLEIFGIRELQQISTGKAIAAIIIPIIILTIIISAIVFFTVFYMITS